MRKNETPQFAFFLRKMPFLWLSLIFFLVFPPSIAFALNLEDRIKKHTLENGLRVLLLQRPLSPTVSFKIRYLVGSVDEESGRTGMSHFVEHLLFKGTTSIGVKNWAEEEAIRKRLFETGSLIDALRAKGAAADGALLAKLEAELKKLQEEERNATFPNEIDRLFSENGGLDMNASASVDLTSFHVSLPANKLEIWARIESDRMVNTVFRDFYPERNVVMEERRQRIEADPTGKLYEQFLAAAFTAHPYRNPILGWTTDILNYSPASAYEFYRRFYAPNNAVIAIVGDIDPEATLAIIKKYFGPIPARPIQRPVITEEPRQRGERRINVIFDANPQVMIGFHKPNLPAKADYVFTLIDYLLTAGRTSRFHRNLVQEKQLAESISTMSAIPGSRFPNLFTIFATPRPAVNIEDLEREIFRELARLKTEPVPEDELAKVRNIIRAEFIRSLNSNTGLASKLSYFEAVAGDYRYILNYMAKIDKITPQQIMETANRYLTADNRTIAVLKRNGNDSGVRSQKSGVEMKNH